jgi:hypothetical protein
MAFFCRIICLLIKPRYNIPLINWYGKIKNWISGIIRLAKPLTKPQTTLFGIYFLAANLLNKK